jgi:hypothetical protein
MFMGVGFEVFLELQVAKCVLLLAVLVTLNVCLVVGNHNRLSLVSKQLMVPYKCSSS